MERSSKDSRDIYYWKAKKAGWRTRSAFELIQLNKIFNLFKGVKKVVDLCAAPGSWSQVLAKELKPCENADVKIVSVDVRAMAPLPGVSIIQGDITEESTVETIIQEFEGEKADLVVCDGVTNVTGLYDMDEFLLKELLTSALNISTYILKEGGSFVAKLLSEKMVSIVYSQMRIFFSKVTISKPDSRNSSIEAFIVCQNYTPPVGYIPTIWTSWKLDEGIYHRNNHVKMIRFLLFGDLNFDADTTFGLEGPNLSRYLFRQPVQEPISPPYEES